VFLAVKVKATMKKRILLLLQNENKFYLNNKFHSEEKNKILKAAFNLGKNKK